MVGSVNREPPKPRDHLLSSFAAVSLSPTNPAVQQGDIVHSSRRGVTGEPSTIRCQVVRQAEEWRRYADAIAELLTTSSIATPHSSTTWLSAWWDAFGAGRELRIGLFWRGSQLVGYAPLMLGVERFLGVPYRVLRFIGEGISDFGDIFSRDDDAGLKAQMVRSIVEEWDWDELVLANVRSSSSTLASFESRRSPRYFLRIRVGERCPFIDLRGQSFEAYLLTLSRKHRRDLRKDRRRLDALGAWSIDFAPGATAEAFDEFRRLHASRSDTMGWSSVFNLPGFRTQYRRLMEQRDGDLQMLVSTLRLGDALVSYTFGFVRNRTYYQWNVGFDHAFEDIAPNKLHHELLIEECFRRGYVEFDFMRGAHEYKFSWTDRARENHDLRMLKRHGWRRVLNRLRWVQERAPGSLTDRGIARLHALRARITRARPPVHASEAN